jgi:hypothetical protein
VAASQTHHGSFEGSLGFGLGEAKAVLEDGVHKHQRFDSDLFLPLQIVFAVAALVRKVLG